MLPTGAPSRRSLAAALFAASLAFFPKADAAEPASRSFPLESSAGLRLINVTAEPALLEGRKGLKLTLAPGGGMDAEQLAVIETAEFSSGVIEAELAGAPAPGAAQGARGFVGVAFRLQPDGKTYDAFYLRPTNGRADDQERRNHAVQYISHPEWTWDRLRKETPSRYEAYVDLLPGTWIKVRIEVHGERARLYVHGSDQPTLIVNDLKTGASAKGGVALWLGPGTIAHFRNLTITPEASAR
jgi:hypothetical protein